MARVAVVSHSFLDNDPRVRRAVDAFLDEGWFVDGLFLDSARRSGALRTWRVPIRRRRGGPFRYAFEYGTFFLIISMWLIRLLAGRRPDVVYVNSPPDAFSLAAWPAKALSIPIVLDIHDPMPELLASKGGSSLFHRVLLAQERWGSSFADALVTVHEPLRELLQSRLGDIPMTVVMNVPDVDTLPSLPPRPGSRTIVYTGTVALRYGLAELVEAVAVLRAEIPGLQLRVIGDGEDLGFLTQLVEDLGVADIVEFRGRRPWEEVSAAQADAWLRVNVPRPDDLGELSFSNKIVEWVTMGLPVIASRTPTLLRYFPEGSLYYVSGGSTDDLAKAIRSIDRDRSTGEHVAAARDALGLIGWPVQRAALVDLVSGLIGR